MDEETSVAGYRRNKYSAARADPGGIEPLIADDVLVDQYREKVSSKARSSLSELENVQGDERDFIHLDDLRPRIAHRLKQRFGRSTASRVTAA